MSKTEPYDFSHRVDTTTVAINVIASADRSLVYRSFPLRGQIIIGRDGSAGATFILDDAKLSRKHATIVANSSHLHVQDHGSTNGTFVNGARVEATQLLQKGDIIRAGETIFEIGPMLEALSDPLLLGRTQAMRALCREIERVAKTTSPVLVVAETGTGKELVSQRVHSASGRPGPLVAVNCSTLTESLAESTLFGHKKGAFTHATNDAMGLFEQSNAGTLFLDEVGTMAPALQPKLLRVLETGEVVAVGDTRPRSVDLRVVAATNLDLRAVLDSQFRGDLYARLAGFELTVPPLRKRRADIPLLAAHFLKQAVPKRAITMNAAFMEALLLYPWPRNVRELRTFMFRFAAGDDDVLTLSHVPDELVARVLPNPLLQTAKDIPGLMADDDEAADLAAPSKEELQKLLEEHNGNVSKIAQLLGRRRQQVYRWLKRYGMTLDAFRES